MKAVQPPSQNNFVLNIDNVEQVISDIPKKSSALYDNKKLAQHIRKKSSPMGVPQKSQRRVDMKSVSSLSEIH